MVEKDLSLRVQEYPYCGLSLTMDRDLNAAKNVLRRGLQSLPINGEMPAYLLAGVVTNLTPVLGGRVCGLLTSSSGKTFGESQLYEADPLSL